MDRKGTEWVPKVNGDDLLPMTINSEDKGETPTPAIKKEEESKTHLKKLPITYLANN